MTSPKAVLHKQGGQGPSVVFIHGFGSDRLSWAANAPTLSDVATVWLVDLPGHGGASDDVGDGTVETLAQAVAEQLRAVEGPMVMVGHSLGAAVAIRVASIMPLAIRRLVLIAPAGLGQELDHDFLLRFPGLTVADDARQLLERLVERKRFIAPAMVSHVLTGLNTPSRRVALKTIAESLVQFLPPELPQGVGVSLVWGDADAINVPPTVYPEGIALLQLPGVGHMPQVEAASKVNATIRAALAA